MTPLSEKDLKVEMGILSKLLGNRELTRFMIAFDHSGDYSVREISQVKLDGIDVIETLSQYYVKTLYMVGESDASRLILHKYDSFVTELKADRLPECDLLQLINQLGLVYELGFDISKHLKITKLNLVREVSAADAIRHQVVLMQKSAGGRTVLTHPAMKQSKIYIPLALFAFANYCSRQYLSSNKILGKILADCASRLHEQERFEDIYGLSGYARLAKYVESFHSEIRRGGISP